MWLTIRALFNGVRQGSIGRICWRESWILNISTVLTDSSSCILNGKNTTNTKSEEYVQFKTIPQNYCFNELPSRTISTFGSAFVITFCRSKTGSISSVILTPASIIWECHNRKQGKYFGSSVFLLGSFYIIRCTHLTPATGEIKPKRNNPQKCVLHPVEFEMWMMRKSTLHS